MKPTLALLLVLTACADPPPTSDASAALTLQRAPLAGDVAHYTFQLGDLRIHRVTREVSPNHPRRAASAVMLLHGDFSTFSSSFLPGLAPYLAARGIDVWGFDRRWTAQPAESPDLSGFPQLGFASAIRDTDAALFFARIVRGRADRLVLAGFSRGGHIAYEYAAAESQRPAVLRQIDGLIPLDVYARVSDEAMRLNACVRRDDARAALAAGIVETDNSFFPLVAELARDAPDEPSPVFEGLTNHEAFLTFLGQTFLFFQPAPAYRLLAADDTTLLYTPEPAAIDWLLGAAPHQPQIELADGEAMWCGEGPLPLADHIADITVPLLYVGAETGFGELGLYSTSLVASSDVTSVIVPGFGHADLLFASDAPTLAWDTIAGWIRAH